MYTMSQAHYTYDTYAAAPVPRQYASHGTSSAFSSSANPDEDWTKISDLAERRRIQNRIAQRNYRKKLKRRLEDLERRAGTSDDSTSAPESKTPSKASGSKKSKSQKSPAASSASKQAHTPQYTPPTQQDDEMAFAQAYDERDRSHTPPYMAYSSYPPPEDVMLAPYGTTAQQHHYQPITTAEAYPAYSVPCTLPSMTHFSDAMKRETPYPEEALTPFMSYGVYPGASAADPYAAAGGSYDQHSNPHTPPLSHSFDHSANCSESGYEYPTTPLSMPDSPNMLGH